jgi:sulfhydrogenase subunit gamma (sulfur reductase)
MSAMNAVEISDRNVYLPRMVRVVEASEMTSTEKFLRVQFVDGGTLDHTPGQFVEVSLFGIGEAPITVASSPENRDYFDMCVRNVGSVTRAIHALEVGDQIGIRGPFGRPFPMDTFEGDDLLFISGGLGLVPLRATIQYAVENRDKFGKVTILYGAKNPEERLFLDELNEWEKRDDVDFRCTVDRASEGWTGNVGVITKLMPDLDIDPHKTTALVVGPPIMYRFVMISLIDKKMPDHKVWMSLERRMKCGVGKCGHCQINDMLVCQEGPTFAFSEIKDLMEAI